MDNHSQQKGHCEFYIGTTRFNNKTYQENVNWRKKHSHNGCVYALKKRVSGNVPKNAIICVLEMNNDTNKIMGIGIIKNKINRQQSWGGIKIHYGNDIYYNRYIYHGNTRLDRSKIRSTSRDMGLIKAFEQLLFKGKGHFKTES